MIASLTGIVADKGANSLVLDVAGVGFEISMAPSSVVRMPGVGDTATVITHLHVKEDALQLYGFITAEEKELFLHLNSVSGIGPKVALSVLSTFSPAALKKAIITEDIELIQAIPGIGKKTAGRLAMELKDKLALPEVAAKDAPGGAQTSVVVEVRGALVGLGYSAPEAARALEGLEIDEAATTEEVLKAALRVLAG